MAKKAEKAKLAKKAAKQQRKVLKAKKTLTKVVKKKWVPMYAPPFFAEQVLGECYIEDAESLIDRKIRISMMNLTRESRKQAISVTFKVISTKGAGVQTAMCGYEMAHNAAKRLVRKGRTKVMDSFLVKTKDKKIIRVKPYIVARSRVPMSLQNKMRLQAREILAQEGARQSYQKFLEDVIQGKIQKGLKVNLQKIYPLSACELRQVVIERADTPLELGDTVMKIPERRPRHGGRDRRPRDDKRSHKPAEAEKTEAKAEKPAKESTEQAPKAEHSKVEEKKEAPKEKPAEKPKEAPEAEPKEKPKAEA